MANLFLRMIQQQHIGMSCRWLSISPMRHSYTVAISYGCLTRSCLWHSSLCNRRLPSAGSDPPLGSAGWHSVEWHSNSKLNSSRDMVGTSVVISPSNCHQAGGNYWNYCPDTLPISQVVVHSMLQFPGFKNHHKKSTLHCPNSQTTYPPDHQSFQPASTN